MQEERKKETTNDPSQDKIRDETAAQIHHFLEKNKLPTLVAGTRKSSDEPSIYENKLQALSQETRDKLAKLEQLQDTIVKVTEEENQVRERLNQFIVEAKQEHGSRIRTYGHKEKKKYNCL